MAAQSTRSPRFTTPIRRSAATRSTAGKCNHVGEPGITFAACCNPLESFGVYRSFTHRPPSRVVSRAVLPQVLHSFGSFPEVSDDCSQAGADNPADQLSLEPGQREFQAIVRHHLKCPVSHMMRTRPAIIGVVEEQACQHAICHGGSARPQVS